MKFQTILRTVWLTTGFAAVLSLAGTARAQEITNDARHERKAGFSGRRNHQRPLHFGAG